VFFFFFFFDGEISHRGDRKKKSSAKVTKDFFGKRTPNSPYFEEKKKSEVRHIFRQIHSSKDVLEKNKIQSRHILGREKGLNSPYLEGAKKF
jgi:hypothetical protein